MSEKDIIVRGPRGRDALHPLVYCAAIGMVTLYVASAWALFDRQNDTGLPLAMVTVLLFVAVAIPYVLWRVARRHGKSNLENGKSTLDKMSGFRQWASGHVEVWQSRLTGIDATIDMLLPFAAMAFGLLALGVVFRLTH